MTLQSLLNLIRCPKCKSPLVHDGDWLVSSDPSCRLKYEIKDQIPILVPEEATEIDSETWAAIMARHNRDRVTGEMIGD